MKGKIKIVHLSDFHCEDGFFFKDISRDFYNTIGNFISKDDVVLSFFTGDLTAKGYGEHFDIFESFFRDYDSFLKNNCSLNYSFLVPGNHDCNFASSGTNVFADYYSFYKRNKSYCRSLPSSDKTISSKLYTINGKKVLIAMLNSAFYCNKNFDDVGKLKANISEIDNFIESMPSCDYRILLAHHQLDMFEYSSSQCLDRLYQNFDIIFDGHNHNQKTKDVTKGCFGYVLFDGGVFWDNQKHFDEASFSLFDLLDESIVEKSYVRSTSGFQRATSKKIPLMKSDKNALLKRSLDFEIDFFADELGIYNNIIDGFEDFEICKLEDVNSDDRYAFSFKDSIRQLIKDCNQIAIYGKDFTSKTTALKYVFKEISDEVIPLYVGKESMFNCNSSKGIERAINQLIVEQYGIKQTEIDNISNKKVLVLIDDWDKIQNQIKSMLLDYVAERFGKVLVTLTYDPLDQRRVVDERIESFSKYLIEDMNHKEMLSLIKSSIKKLSDDKSGEDNVEDCVEIALNALDNNLSSYKHIPFFVRNISKFVFYNNSGQSTNSTNFSAIFDLNIKRLISDKFPDKRFDFTDTVISCLSELAFSNYQTNSQYFSEEEMTKAIADVLYKKDIINLKADEVLDIFYDTHIVVKKGDSYGFENRITFAYFVATKVEELSGYDSTGTFNYKEFTDEARKNIFISINSEILLFLIYKKNDIALIKRIMDDSEQFFDFDDYNCISHQYQLVGKDIGESTKIMLRDYDKPQAKKKKKRKKEKEIDEQSEVFEGLNYSEQDKKYYSCLNYLRTLGTAFSGLFEKIDRDIKIELINKLFVYPNKFINYLLNTLDEFYVLEEKMIKEGQAESVEIFSQSIGIIKEIKKALVVYIYDYVAKFCTNKKTYPNLIKYNDRTENYIDFQKLMFAFYSGGKAFQNKLRDFAEKHGKDKMCMYLARVTFSRFVERTGKYELSYNTDLLDKLKIKKAKPKLLTSEARKNSSKGN